MIKILNLFQLKSAFLLSVFSGFIIWFFFYIFSPVNSTGLISETLLFIGSSVLVFLLGYYVFNINTKTFLFKSSSLIVLFYVIATMSLIGITFRYLDLFLFREISFSNPYFQNKLLSDSHTENAGLLIASLSSLRVLYFVPLLLLIITKSKNKLMCLISIALIIYSSVEIFLFGTRKPLFYLMIIVIITLFYFNKSKLQFSKKSVFYIISSTLVLAFFSFFILNKRLKENNFNKEHALIDVVNSRYNDFVKIKPSKLKSLIASPKSVSTKAQIMFIHTGQYVIHGFYELNYIVKNKFPKAYGVYSFNPIFKLTNRLGVTNKSLNTIKNHPRDYVYTSFYGSLFIDFGWFALIPMFLLGLFQRWVYSLTTVNIIAKVFFVILLSINLVMPIFNILSGTGLYLFFLLLAFLCISYKKNDITEVYYK